LAKGEAAAAGFTRPLDARKIVTATLDAMNRGSTWAAADSTGGPQDELFDQLGHVPGGEPTFYIENGGRHQTAELQEAVDVISRYLEQSRPSETTSNTNQADKS
jgi:hypothetical protein